jgi:hypothetical protein
MKVPVSGLNFPEEDHLLSFPPEVQVTFLVGVSRYTRIKPEDFIIGIDYQDMMASNSKTMPLKLVKTPSYIRQVRITPLKVDCLIEKTVK